MMKKLLLIDGNSILNRAYYGIRPLTAPDGTPTNAVYGFLNILFKYLEEEKPDYLCVAFDVKAKTFRHKMYDQYKQTGTGGFFGAAALNQRSAWRDAVCLH